MVAFIIVILNRKIPYCFFLTLQEKEKTMTGISLRAFLGWTLLLSLIAFGPAPSAQAIGTPHLVYGDLATSNETTPANDKVAIEAFIASRPDEILTDAHAGTGYRDGQWWVEAGNFPTPWAEGETLRLVAANLNTGESRSQTIVLGAEGQQQTDLIVPPGGGIDDGDDDGDDTDTGDGDSGETNNCFIATASGQNGYGWAAGLLLLLGALTAVLGRQGKTRRRFRALLAVPAMALPLLFFGPAPAQAVTASFSLQTGINAVSMPVGNSGIATAADLIADIGDGALSVRYWRNSQQAYVIHQRGEEATDFAIVPGLPYFIEMDRDFIWHLEGDALPARNQDLVTTQSTDVNAVAIPLERTDLRDAEQLANEIPNCDTVWYWDTERGGYVGHPIGTTINNFSIEPGYGYFVNVDQGGAWNQTGGGDTDNVHGVAPGSAVQFRVRVSQAVMGDLTLPLTYEITRAVKEDAEIDVPENLSFNEETGEFSWRPTVDQMGAYAFEVKVMDGDMYSETQTVYVTVGTDDQLISDAAASPMFITPAADGETVIFYTLTEAADVTIDLYTAGMSIDAQGDGRFQREFLTTLLDREPRPAGESSFTWDGRNGNGEIVPPSAYVFIIKAETDDGRLSVWGFDYTGGDVTVSDGAVVDPETGEPAASFNPYAGETVEIRYSLFQPAWVTIGGENIRGFAIEGAPRNEGTNTELWDGKNTLGEVVADGTVLQLNAKAELLPENAIVVQAPPLPGDVVASITAEPYVMTPAYGDVSTLRYTLARDAAVEIRIKDTQGNEWVHMEKEARTADDYTSVWNGLNGEGRYVRPWSEPTAPGAGGPQEDFTVEIVAYDDADRVIDRKQTNIHAYR
jgi:hypothetical protein